MQKGRLVQNRLLGPDSTGQALMDLNQWRDNKTVWPSQVGCLERENLHKLSVTLG